MNQEQYQPRPKQTLIISIFCLLFVLIIAIYFSTGNQNQKDEAIVNEPALTDSTNSIDRAQDDSSIVSNRDQLSPPTATVSNQASPPGKKGESEFEAKIREQEQKFNQQQKSAPQL